MVEKKAAKSSVSPKKTGVTSEENGKKNVKKKAVIGDVSSKKETAPAVLKKTASAPKETIKKETVKTVSKKVSETEKKKPSVVKKAVKAEPRKVSSKKPEKQNSNRREAIAQEKAKKHPQLTKSTGVFVEQYRSSIRQPEKQRKQLESLGLGKIGKKRLLPKIPVISKLVDRLKHLVRIVK